MDSVFSVYDSKAECYSPPFVCVSIGVAVRQMLEVCSDRNTSVFKYPQDFTLYRIGDWNPVTGSFVAVIPAEHICEMGSLVNRIPQMGVSGNGAAVGDEASVFTGAESDNSEVEVQS